MIFQSLWNSMEKNVSLVEDQKELCKQTNNEYVRLRDVKLVYLLHESLPALCHFQLLSLQFLLILCTHTVCKDAG